MRLLCGSEAGCIAPSEAAGQPRRRYRVWRGARSLESSHTPRGLIVDVVVRVRGHFQTCRAALAAWARACSHPSVHPSRARHRQRQAAQPLSGAPARVARAVALACTHHARHAHQLPTHAMPMPCPRHAHAMHTPCTRTISTVYHAGGTSGSRPRAEGGTGGGASGSYQAARRRGIPSFSAEGSPELPKARMCLSRANQACTRE